MGPLATGAPKKPGLDRVNGIVFLIVYKTVETNSFWIYMYEAKVFFIFGGGKLVTMTLKTKSQIMQFSFFILFFSEGYVGHKGYSCNSLGKQTREPCLIREILRGEMSILFNVDLCNHDQPFCV